ncbi:TELO2 interacting protein 1 [Musa troglodytarum]|uniref:TELO2 interacting protein 1 n=1 Tax=Musa troglodytarum TaxID=320322 RepID=A0A9E7EMW0_9LILI|nr:TELO2 interacting protein 1 [Musa troglodytarum]
MTGRPPGPPPTPRLFCSSSLALSPTASFLAEMADFLRRAPAAALQPSLDYGLSSHPRQLVAHLSQSALVSSFDFCVQELGSEFDVLLDSLFDWVDFYCLPSYSLFRFLLLLDAAVQCREEKKAGSDGGFGNGGAPLGGHAISDSAAEGMLMCLEELLKKCHLGSVNQAAELEAERTVEVQISEKRHFLPFVSLLPRYYERQSLKMAFAMATSDPTLDLNSS